MVVFDVQVVLPMSAVDYLKAKNTDAFKRFHMNAMGTLEQENLSHDVIDGQVVTVTRMVPSIEIPWALRRAILGTRTAEFIDERKWRFGTHLTPPFEQLFTITNNITDRCVVSGKIVISDVRNNQCLVRVEGEAVVTLKGFGKAVETLVVNNMRASYDKLPGIMQDWARRGETRETENAPGEFATPGATRTRARRDSSRRTGAFGSVIDVQQLTLEYDVETGLASGSNRWQDDDDDDDDEFKSNEAKARAFGRNKNETFVARGRSLLVNAFTGDAGRGDGRQKNGVRSLRSRNSATSNRRKTSKNNRKKRICGARRSTFLCLLFFAAAAYAWFSFLPAGSSFGSRLSQDAHHLEEVLEDDSRKLPHLEETMDAVGEAGLEVIDAAADEVGHGRENENEDDSETDDSVHDSSVVSSSVPCVDETAEQCQNWACAGECAANPGFMNAKCACACFAVASREKKEKVAAQKPDGLGSVSGVSFGVRWVSPSRKQRNARIRVHLHSNVDAPKTLAALRHSLRSGRCGVGGSADFCAEASCHFHRAESAYGLLQGTLFGLGAAGGTFGAARLEGKRVWRRGTVGYIPGGDNVLIATKPHPEWDQGFVAFGEVFEDDLVILDELVELSTRPFTHPTFGTVMAMLENKVQFVLRGIE